MGTLKDAKGNSVKDATIRITLNNNKYATRTDNTGTYKYIILANNIGNNQLKVDYDGNNYLILANAQTTFNVRKLTSTLTINKIPNTKYGNTYTITGTLKDENNKALKQAITLKINQNTYNINTDEGGSFTKSINADTMGTNNIIATYNGNNNVEATTSKTSFTVLKQDLQLTLDNIATTTYDNNINIKGKLSDKNGKNLANNNIKITINNQDITLKTDTNGAFTYTTKATTVGTNKITAQHEGNNNYNPTTITKTFTINKEDTTITINKIPTTTKTNTATITGKLTDKNGKILPNTSLKININDESITTTTNNNGTYTYKYKTNTSGTNNVTVTYNGNTNYNPTSIKTTFKVPKQTKMTIPTYKTKQYKQKVTITGKLTTKDGKALRNSKVTLTINGKKKTAKTNTKGAYTLTVTAKTGKNTLVASFAGNRYYNKLTLAKKVFTLV